MAKELSEDKLFRLRPMKDGVVCRCGVTAKKTIILIAGTENSQADLKEVYDAGRHFQKWVEAPAGYKAPWQP